MSTNRVIFTIGILILAVPLTGFPRMWDEVFLIVAGIALILLSSINIWQRSIVKRLQFHSKQQINQDSTNEEVAPSYTSEE